MSFTTEHPALLKARQQAKLQAQASKMSITQSFYLANQARGKLASEAAKSDHQLRRLVGHANLLDRLMLHLSEAEQEQDAWFNNMVRGNAVAEEERLQSWETISEEPTYMAADYSDSESDSDEEDIEEDDFSLLPALTATPSRKQDARTYIDTIVEVDEVEEDDEDDSDEDGLYTLERTTSHRPPSLVSDASDSEDDEDNTPPSPQSIAIQPVLSEKQRQQLVTTSYYEPSEHQSSEEAYFLPSQQSMISAY